MNILILNWRDKKNPLSGGAEVLTHDFAERFAKRGDCVTIFCSDYTGAKKQEEINNVTVIRKGHPDARTLFRSVQFQAFLYVLRNSGKIDLLIDEIHGVPFFTPLYFKKKKIALICEVAGDLWDKAVRFPFNEFGKLLEHIYPFLYKDVLTITISDSTKNELEKEGFKNIHIIHPGCDVPILKHIPTKEKSPTLIFLARISKSKGMEDMIFAMRTLVTKIPDIRLWVVGRGEKEYTEKLKKLIKLYNLSEQIIFKGFVSQEEKISYLSSAHLLITPSMKEGWGLTVHEAGACFTPVITYNVPGLRDVVKDGVSGIVCKENTPDEIARNVIKIIADKKIYKKLQENAVKERRKFTWENCFQEILDLIKKV